MSEHDVEKLLGGFAADTLMPEERIRLYTAAMQDQQVVNALSDEQALKELLADPQVRDRLRRALRKSDSSASVSRRCWFRRPAGFALAGGLAALLFAAFGTKMYLERLDRGAPSISTEHPSPINTPASSNANVTGAPASPLSARALFYGTRSIDAAAAPRPLGLRYSFMARTNGQAREIEAAAAARSTGPVRLTVEANQDAFLQILQSLGSAGTRLWWPTQETGKISLKVQAGKRSEIPLPPPAEGGLLHLTIRLSLRPFAPLTMQEVGMLDRLGANLLIELFVFGGAEAQEQATYVVSQNSSHAAQMAVEIPIRR